MGISWDIYLGTWEYNGILINCTNYIYVYTYYVNYSCVGCKTTIELLAVHWVFNVQKPHSDTPTQASIVHSSSELQKSGSKVDGLDGFLVGG